MHNEMFFNGSIVIGDPCYFVNSEEDWEKSQFGEDISSLGFTNYLKVEYPYNPQVVKNESNGEIIGGICQDSCVLVVIYKDELEKYNPNYEEAFGSKSNWTLIEDFKGIVSFESIVSADGICGITLIGNGNKVFKSFYEGNRTVVSPNDSLQNEVSKIIGFKLDEMNY